MHLDSGVGFLETSRKLGNEDELGRNGDRHLQHKTLNTQTVHGKADPCHRVIPFLFTLILHLTNSNSCDDGMAGAVNEVS